MSAVTRETPACRVGVWCSRNKTTNIEKLKNFRTLRAFYEKRFQNLQLVYDSEYYASSESKNKIRMFYTKTRPTACSTALGRVTKG